jgi:hypothetical protein
MDDWEKIKSDLNDATLFGTQYIICVPTERISVFGRAECKEYRTLNEMCWEKVIRTGLQLFIFQGLSWIVGIWFELYNSGD